MCASGARALLLTVLALPLLALVAGAEAPTLVGESGPFDVYRVGEGFYVALIDDGFFDEVRGRFYLYWAGSPEEHSRLTESPFTPVVEDLGASLGPGEEGAIGPYSREEDFDCRWGVAPDGRWWVRINGEKRYVSEPEASRALRGLGVEASAFSVGRLVVFDRQNGVITERLDTVAKVYVHGPRDALLDPRLGEAVREAVLRDCGVPVNVVVAVEEAWSLKKWALREETYERISTAWDRLGLPLYGVGGMLGFPLLVGVDGLEMRSRGVTLDWVLSVLDREIPPGLAVLVVVRDYKPTEGSLLPGQAGGSGVGPEAGVAAAALAVAVAAALVAFKRRRT
ncbi:hypothetical protein ASQ66_gp28 [Aeropyrum pernix spindle-shaped virus 1]|uniref:Uncharacterized protein n=1 Tax=Aeropyrum pernix (strain ATCC 700893 / DSM 11879 / JCM 9820 / NBRC 100138 / K1) TaxID=272557 RepID=Q9YDQ7_AERPE|nr:hypothetical protein [Aeropyrum pernix]YP_009177758.1 hypothetical protein ASQ66_gp28 [Aeropyrum pernix spindle-shaped virus 1]BAA79840.1 hypothetical protein APE_0860 [Aeropyrum pernix spindle-shaped virus 1] [Aeropyrum pernix K1]CCD22116.1 TPA: hypothetical protein [Aeropyrum pernix spindle-shaped virus 1]